MNNVRIFRRIKPLRLLSLALLVLLLAVSCRDKDNLDDFRISFETLINEPIRGIIQDKSDGFTLDPTKFDIVVEVENEFLYEKPTIRFDGDTIVLDIHPKGKWCECLFPNTVKVKVISTPKEGAFEDEEFYTTITPIQIKLIKERTWFSRCLWLLLTITGLLLLMFFLLRALIKKNHLKKENTTDNSDLYPNEKEEKEEKEKEEVEEEQKPQEQEGKKGEDCCGNNTLD